MSFWYENNDDDICFVVLKMFVPIHCNVTRWWWLLLRPAVNFVKNDRKAVNISFLTSTHGCSFTKPDDRDGGDVRNNCIFVLVVEDENPSLLKVRSSVAKNKECGWRSLSRRSPSPSLLTWEVQVPDREDVGEGLRQEGRRAQSPRSSTPTLVQTKIGMIMRMLVAVTMMVTIKTTKKMKTKNNLSTCNQSHN